MRNWDALLHQPLLVPQAPGRFVRIQGGQNLRGTIHIASFPRGKAQAFLDHIAGRESFSQGAERVGRLRYKPAHPTSDGHASRCEVIEERGLHFMIEAL